MKPETGVCKNNVPPSSEATAAARGRDANPTYMSAPGFIVVEGDVCAGGVSGLAK